MQLFENISLAINGLRANKMRALLTMLGIIIGISSVIAIVTVGDSMTSSVEGVFNDMGANSIQMQINDKPDENGNYNWSRPWEDSDMITDEMIDNYFEKFGSQIDCWAVSVGVGSGKAHNGRQQVNAQVQGLNANALGIQNIKPLAGHDLSEREVAGAKSVVVVSSACVEKLFPGATPQEALGREIKLVLATGTYTVTIVGVYKYEVSGFAATMVGDTTQQMFIPITTAQTMIDNPSAGYYNLQVKAVPEVKDTKKLAADTERFFNRTYYRGNKYVEVKAMSMDSMIGDMTSMMDTMKMAISVIAGISLLVGGIGVMNIMLVSVTERTREIGTRKALGAKSSAIRVQFIVEAMIICLIGGVIGVSLGAGLGWLGSGLMGENALPSVGIVVVAVTFSMAIGVFFGYYPANKAAKLDPIEALRYE